MASLFFAGMDLPSQEWLLHRGEGDAFVDFKALERAVAMKFVETDQVPTRGSTPKKGSCAANPLMVMDYEKENYVLGRTYAEEPYGEMFGMGKALDQRFYLRLGRTAPEIVMCSKFEGGYFMLRKIVMKLDNSPDEDASVVFVHENDLNKVFLTVIMKNMNTDTVCKCAPRTCACGNTFGSIEDVSNFYQVLRRQKLRSPWSAFSDFMKVLPSIKTVRDMNAFAMINGQMSPLCSRRVQSKLKVVRNTVDLEMLKYMFVQDLLERLTIQKPLQQQHSSAAIAYQTSSPIPAADYNSNGSADFFGFNAGSPQLDEVFEMSLPPTSTQLDVISDLGYVDMVSSGNTVPHAFAEEVTDSVAQASDLYDENEPVLDSQKVFDIFGGDRFESSETIGSPVDDELSNKREDLKCSPEKGCQHSQETKDLYSLGSPVDDDADGHQTKEKPTCQYCGATFKRKYEMQRHTKSIHLKEKRHTCDVCGKGFFQRSHMTVHMQTVHERKKDDVCSACGRSFATKYKVDRHYRAVHLHERAYKCHHCGSDYYQNSDLKRHLKLQHADARSAQSVFFPGTISPSL
eukprot:CAMPEP_0198734800 /NCGR_PEP_ID=MMETSP1475-20131203/55325_1 /TAXON_ID= ORGANISM="Unidentified sp., Strain CCMP1999" /NCGR_SAMPLE_ID=MMETSP1475 /ASSEMBLY_ACC=CAM_ASM_001111 /LENGTH=571 /DNA_ID=CAMNT_0044498347 /DNA_START=129 /DNA_END=1841 /DNA_ORIENTATION=-